MSYMNLSHISDEEIRGRIEVRVILLLFKYIFRDELREKLYEIFRLLKELESKRSVIEYIETLLRYIASATDKIEKEDIDKVIREIEGGEELMPTLAEKWIEEGKEIGEKKGREEGREEGKREDILSILAIKFGAVPEDIRQRIEHIDDIGILDQLLEAAITSEDMNRFREKLFS